MLDWEQKKKYGKRAVESNSMARRPCQTLRSQAGGMIPAKC